MPAARERKKRTQGSTSAEVDGVADVDSMQDAGQQAPETAGGEGQSKPVRPDIDGAIGSRFKQRVSPE